MDYSKCLKARAEPLASSMIETLRAIGYSPETAIADIIDNSISANANNIIIKSVWNGADTHISILDDGNGMNNDALIDALRPGSKNPLEERSESDLGRFGLGLKTASFSQTRKFTVFSKAKDYRPCYWTWDLDFVNKQQAWDLVKYAPDSEIWEAKLDTSSSGTCVLWWQLDRLIGLSTDIDNVKAKSKFLQTLDNIKKHISMVFHQYIDEGLNIVFNERKVTSWDPFMIGTDSLQTKPESSLSQGNIKIKGFILPHRSKLSPEEYIYGKGPKDSWTAHQGFYVYRNKRLLVAGDWLGFFKKEVHYDLSRIKIELPNNMDKDWKIDIKKSIANPPIQFREQILAIAKEVRNQAVEVYRHKGKVIRRKLSKDEYYPLWEEKVRHGKRFYKINRKHPIVENLKNIDTGLTEKIEDLLQFVEETVPVPLISLQESESDKVHGKPFESKNHDVIKRTMQIMYQNLISSGRTHSQSCTSILATEPFDSFAEYLELLKK